MKRIKNLQLLFLVVILLSLKKELCPKNNVLLTKKAKNVVVPVQSQKYRSDVLFLYTKALLQQGWGKLTEAVATYAELFKLHPPRYVYEGYIKFLFEAQEYAKLLALDKKILTYFPHNWELSLQWAQALLYTGKEVEACVMLADLRNQHPDNEQIVYYETIALLKQNKLNEALEKLNDFLARAELEPKHSLFYFLQSKIYLQQNEPTKALTAIEKSLVLYPNFDKGILFKSLLLEQMGRLTEAINGYKRFLEVVPADATIEKQLVALLFSQERYVEALEALRKMHVDTPEYYFDIALIAWKAQNFDEALQHITTVLVKNDSYPRAKLLKAEILLAAGKLTELELFIRDWIAVPDATEMALQVCMVLAQGHMTDQVVNSILEHAVNRAPSRKRIIALADFYATHDGVSQALEQYKALFAYVKSEETEFKSKIFYQMGYLYFSKKELKKAEAMLKKSLTYRSPCLESFNLLAFLYAEYEPSKLSKALALVEKALAHKPDSATYLDTKGWILHKLGKQKEACLLFEKALKIAPQDNVIAEHLALAKEVK